MTGPEGTNRNLFEQISREYVASETAGETYLPVTEQELNNLIPLLPAAGIVLIGLYCVQDFGAKKGFTLFYVLEKRGRPNLMVLQREIQGNHTASISVDYPSACWFEREIRDGFGLEFDGAFDQRRLFLHEAYPPGFHPLLKSFENRAPRTGKNTSDGRFAYRYKEVEGEGVYEVLVGPVHAGIIEPGHFRFSVIGETIFNLEIRMFYKHRGIEKLAEGKIPDQGVGVAESISGDESAANAIAFCMAVEKISGVELPQKAWYLRTILLEMERIYSHLGDLSGMIVDVAYSAGAAEFGILREEVLQYNRILTGSRFIKGIIRPGGLRKDIQIRDLLSFSTYLETFLKRFMRAVDAIHRLDSVIDRLETTGVIRPELVNPLNITGPAARASGIKIDTRIDHPYGLYPLLDLKYRTVARGDVLSRFDIKVVEVVDAINIIRKLIDGLGEIRSSAFCTSVPSRDGFALSLIEAPRGQSLHFIYLKNGLIDRYKVRTASFCNWQAIEHAVIGNIVPDFPLINKSLNLSYAGTDL
jgi:formate hydrogenlyase subunit 5